MARVVCASHLHCPGRCSACTHVISRKGDRWLSRLNRCKHCDECRCKRSSDIGQFMAGRAVSVTTTTTTTRPTRASRQIWVGWCERGAYGRADTKKTTMRRENSQRVRPARAPKANDKCSRLKGGLSLAHNAQPIIIITFHSLYSLVNNYRELS